MWLIKCVFICYFYFVCCNVRDIALSALLSFWSAVKCGCVFARVAGFRLILEILHLSVIIFLT